MISPCWPEAGPVPSSKLWEEASYQHPWGSSSDPSFAAMKRSDLGCLVTADDKYTENAVPRDASQRWGDAWGVRLVGFYR